MNNCLNALSFNVSKDDRLCGWLREVLIDTVTIFEG